MVAERGGVERKSDWLASDNDNKILLYTAESNLRKISLGKKICSILSLS